MEDSVPLKNHLVMISVDLRGRALNSKVILNVEAPIARWNLKRTLSTFQQIFASNVAGKTMLWCPSMSFESASSSHRHKCIANIQDLSTSIFTKRFILYVPNVPRIRILSCGKMISQL